MARRKTGRGRSAERAAWWHHIYAKAGSYQGRRIPPSPAAASASSDSRILTDRQIQSILHLPPEQRESRVRFHVRWYIADRTPLWHTVDYSRLDELVVQATDEVRAACDQLVTEPAGTDSGRDLAGIDEHLTELYAQHRAWLVANPDACGMSPYFEMLEALEHLREIYVEATYIAELQARALRDSYQRKVSEEVQA